MKYPTQASPHAPAAGWLKPHALIVNSEPSIGMLSLTLCWIVILDILQSHYLNLDQSLNFYNKLHVLICGFIFRFWFVCRGLDSAFSFRFRLVLKSLAIARSLSAWGVAMNPGVCDSYAPNPPLPAWLWFTLTCCGVAIAFMFRIRFKFRLKFNMSKFRSTFRFIFRLRDTVSNSCSNSHGVSVVASAL